jgi:glutathione synthase/RimK-type ligase-like ATP-grasp enzyme
VFFKLVQNDGNLASLHELLLVSIASRSLCKFLPAIVKGDKRVVVDGEPVGAVIACLRRKRSNMHVGGRPEKLS